MKREADFWEKIEDNKVQCRLCSHNCKINNNQIGICGVRKNENGKLFTLIYGSCSSTAIDPIEKKPLYHFFPGTNAYSIGTIGCNFKCSHCQNYGISTADQQYPYLQELTPEQIVEQAKENNCQGIAYTYNEPTIWHEYCYDCAKLANSEGLYNVYVSNGYIMEDPLKEISPFLDAINVDVKAFNNNFYRNICKANLDPVLKTCRLVKELNIHLELTYLVIPNHNDSIDEIRDFCKWVVDKLGNSTPVHFSRFHPDYKMTNVQSTSMDTLLKIYEAAKKAGILYPYLGNVLHGDYENTNCPNCGNLCIERKGFLVSVNGIIDSKCRKCGKNLSIIEEKNFNHNI